MEVQRSLIRVHGHCILAWLGFGLEDRIHKNHRMELEVSMDFCWCVWGVGV